MNHPDFRVAGKIFATTGYPQEGWAMVKFTPEQQQEFLHDVPEVFVPVKGNWGKMGCTNVLLKKATTEAVRKALYAAWCNRAPKHVIQNAVQKKQEPRKTSAAVRKKNSLFM